jgi:hypothetical protein
MNDRIKELANLAGWKYILGGNPRTRIEDRDYIVTKEQAEKFAELIVKECVAKLEEDYIPEEDIIEGYNEDWDDALHYAVTTIKEHFGVK